jgi:hypothetical protein
MTFAKPIIDKAPEEFNAEMRLMCYAHGCPNKWSVQVGGSKPMCSAHQWSDPDEWGAITGRLNAQRISAPQPKSIANYYDAPKDPLEGYEF